MQVLDRTGVGTLWSICKTKFALAGHTHNYAGSGSAGGSANSAISVVDYGQTSKTIQIGYAGSGITGEQIKYIAGYTSGSGDVNAKIKDVSKDALRSWLGLGSLAYSSATITDNKVAQNAVKSSDYTNWRSLVFSAANSATEGFTPSTTTDGVFIANTLSVQPSSGTIKANKFKGALEGNASTASNASTVNGHTVNANVPSNAKFTDTNTWRGIHDNLTSTSTSESLSANQGRVLKGLVDGKANSSHTHTLAQITNAGAAASKNVRTLNSVSHSSWASASTDALYVPTMSFIAYWNGAYNSSGNSNLQYCYKGKFGNLAVKDTADWSQVANKPATATRWPSWGEVTSKPDLKNWSETKSYIDSKVDSDSNIFSIKGYLQKQLDQLDLKVGVCTKYCGYNNFGSMNVTSSLGKYIADSTMSRIALDSSLNSMAKLNREIYYNSQVLGKYYYQVSYSNHNKYSVSFYDPLGNIVKTQEFNADASQVGIICRVISHFDTVYIIRIEKSENNIFNIIVLTILDKSLNVINSLRYKSNYNIGQDYDILDLGDNGVFIRSNFGIVVYKNGSFSDVTNIEMEYKVNGNTYSPDTFDELINGTLSINGDGAVIQKNGVDYFCLYKIKDLSKNVDYQILIPLDLFGEYVQYTLIKCNQNTKGQFSNICVSLTIEGRLYIIRIYKE